MPSIALIQILQEKITKYLQTRGTSLEQLAESLDIRLSTLRRVLDGGDSGSSSFYDTFLILTHTSPDDASAILEEFFPDLMDEFSRNPKAEPHRVIEQNKSEIRKQPNIVQVVFQSVHHYRLYAWILAGITREDILKKFGADGITLLDEFIAKQVAAVLSDGTVIPIIEDVVVMTNNDLKRQVELNTELIEFGTTEAWIFSRTAGLNAHAMSEIRSILREARRQIHEIMADESNSGALPMHVSMMTDFVR
jgi:hypothetical protein